MLAAQDWLDTGNPRTLRVPQGHDGLMLEVLEGELGSMLAALQRLMGGVAKLKAPLLLSLIHISSESIKG